MTTTDPHSYRIICEQDALWGGLNYAERAALRPAYLEMARDVLERLRSLPESWTLDTRDWLPDDGHYGAHTRDTFIELFDLIRMHPTASAKTLADGLGRSTSWFNSLTRSCRLELGIA